MNIKIKNPIVKTATLFVSALFLMGIMCLLVAGIVMFLWNYVMVGIFSLPTIGFWKACGLLFLCKILFGDSISISNNNKK